MNMEQFLMAEGFLVSAMLVVTVLVAFVFNVLIAEAERDFRQLLQTRHWNDGERQGL